MKIITNNQPRPLLSWYDLTEEEQCSASFFRYKGQVWCLDEFVRNPLNGMFSDWDGHSATSAFSGVLIKFIHSIDDEIVVGRCYS